MVGGPHSIVESAMIRNICLIGFIRYSSLNSILLNSVSLPRKSISTPLGASAADRVRILLQALMGFVLGNYLHPCRALSCLVVWPAFATATGLAIGSIGHFILSLLHPFFIEFGDSAGSHESSRFFH